MKIKASGLEHNYQAFFIVEGNGCYCREPIRSLSNVPSMGQALANRLGNVVFVRVENWNDMQDKGLKFGPYNPV